VDASYFPVETVKGAKADGGNYQTIFEYFTQRVWVDQENYGSQPLY